MIDIAEQICQAVDRIISERLKGINYDTTITATIVDNSHANQYYYTVSTGEAQFTAFAADNTYEIDDSVLVTIPNNDYEQQKIIIGKNVKEQDNKPYRYVKPFSTLVDVSANIVDKTIKGSLLANETGKEEQLLWSWSAGASELSLDGYTRIGLQGQFMTWLEGLDAIMGDYGYKLVITSEPDAIIGDASSQATEDKTNVITTFYLSSLTDMIGNPYRYTAYHEQEKVFDISDLNKILQVDLYFYQEPDTFLDSNGKILSTTDDKFLNSRLPDNLFTKDAYLCFGYDVNEFENEAAYLYSINSSTYNRTQSVETNRKFINLRWIHKYEDGSMGVMTELPDKYEVRWYRYALGSPSADQYSGVYWTEAAIKKQEADQPFNFTLDPDIYLCDIEQIKAIIYDETGKPVVRSNIITFRNEDEVANQTTIQVIQGLNIECDDELNGNYYMYGQNNQLFDNMQSSKVRTLSLKFKEIGSDTFTDLGEYETITWNCPTKNTMIRAYSKAHNQETFQFTINPTYNATAIDNTISCQVEKNGLTYTATYEMRFGIMGTNGTDATLVLDFDYPVLGVQSGQDIIATLRLYDFEHKEVDLSNSSLDITIAWELVTMGDETKVEINNTEPIVINQKKISTSLTKIPDAYYATIKATVKGFGDYPLVVERAIPITINRNIYPYASIPTEVIYSSTGYADYFKSPIKLWTTNDEGKELEQENIDWSIQRFEESPYIGTISSKNILQPLKFYVQKAKPYTISGATHIQYELVEGISENNFLNSKNYLYIQDDNGNFRALEVTDKFNINTAYYQKIQNTIVWAQPLVIMQNQYPSTTVNQWNGKIVEVGEDYILSPMMAAGSKDGYNRFSGVMMGDMGISSQNNTNDISEQTGIYGFHQGAMSFAFKEDGTAFIGKSGSGRIHFDGTSSTIKSEAWGDTQQSGLYMDLNNGIIKLQSNGQRYLAQMIRKEDFDNRGNIVYYEKKAQYDDIDRNQPYNNQLIYYYRKKNTEDEYKEYVVDLIPENWNKEETYVSLSEEAFKEYAGDIYIKDNQSTGISYIKYEDPKPNYVMGKFYKLLEADPNQYATQRFVYEEVKEFKEHNNNGTSVYFTLEKIDQKYITISSEEKQYPIAIGTASTTSLRNFKVDWDGTCYITDGIFQGTISADGGRIAAWIIEKTKLIGLGGNLLLDANAGIILKDYDEGGITLDNSLIELPYKYIEKKEGEPDETIKGYGTFGIKNGEGVNDTGPAIETYIDGNSEYRARFIAGYKHIGMSYSGGGYIAIDENGVNLNSQFDGVTVNIGQGGPCKIDINGNISTSGNILANGTINGVSISTDIDTNKNTYDQFGNAHVYSNTIVVGSKDLQYAYFG